MSSAAQEPVRLSLVEGAVEKAHVQVDVAVARDEYEALVHPWMARVADEQAQARKRSRHIVEEDRPAVEQHRVSYRGRREVDHDRDVELSRLGEDRKRQVAIVGRPMVVHGIELQSGQAKLGDRALELCDRRLDTAKFRVHGRHADERLRILRHQGGDVVVALVDAWRTVHSGDAGDVDRPACLVARVLGGGDREDRASVDPHAGVVADERLGVDRLPQVLEALPIVVLRIAVLGQ